MTEFSEPGRPTHLRLRAAMGLSAFSIAVILAIFELLIDFAAGISVPGPEHEAQLTVRIKTDEANQHSESTMAEKTAPSLSQPPIVPAERVERQQEVATISPPEPPADSPPVKDWSGIAKAAAKATVHDRFRNEEVRASMWRQTGSIMFAPTGEFELTEEEPVISNFRFKPEIHVVGLGVTIGSCFIGIPILGVPIEQRTVAINLVVCAQDSG